MSFITETWLMCDNPKFPVDAGQRNAFGLDDRSLGLSAATLRRQAAKSDGWTNRGAKDYCNYCSPKLAEAPKEPQA